MALGVASGIEKSRLGPEFLEPVAGLIQDQQSRRAEGVDPTDIAKVMTMFGRTGAPGMQGQYGAAIANKLGGAITGAAQGSMSQEERAALMYRSAGFGKPGGTAGFDQATERLEGGLTPTMLRDLVHQIKSESGEGFEGRRRLSTVAGITSGQAGAVMRSAEGATTDKDLAEIIKSAEPIEKQALEQMKILGHEAKHQSGLMDKGIKEGSIAAPIVEAIEQQLHLVLKEILTAIVDIKDFMKTHWPFGKSGEDLKKDIAAVGALPSARHGSLSEYISGEQKTFDEGRKSALEKLDMTEMQAEKPGAADAARKHGWNKRGAQIDEYNRMSRLHQQRVAAAMTVATEMKRHGMDPSSKLPKVAQDYIEEVSRRAASGAEADPAMIEGLRTEFGKMHPKKSRELAKAQTDASKPAQPGAATGGQSIAAGGQSLSTGGQSVDVKVSVSQVVNPAAAKKATSVVGKGGKATTRSHH
jgi:hypothetical protein